MTSLLAVIELGFDPLLRVGEITVRWQTLGVTLALLVALAVAALMAPAVGAQRPFFARRRPTSAPKFPDAPRPEADGTYAVARPLRIDDLLVILAAIVPGAVIGGRLAHAVSFWDAYAADPLRLLDPALGSLSLLGAVLGGLASAVYVARLIGAPVARWADAGSVPLLLALGLGKLAQLLGGSGQGLPFDGAWAVAFIGDGRWVSANPGMAAHPAQVYEALWLLIGIPIVLRWGGARRVPLRVNPLVAWADRSAVAGRLFMRTLTWFLLGRVLVGFVWRDEAAVGPLNAEQALALAILVGTELGLRLRLGRQMAAAAP